MSFLSWAKRCFPKFKEDRSVNHYCEIEPLKFLKKPEPCPWGGNHNRKGKTKNPRARMLFALFPGAAQTFTVLAKKHHSQNGAQLWAARAEGLCC